MRPGVSVVIPTHRRPAKLARCLAALAATDYPYDRLEVVVVEDGGPAPELEELRARDPGPLRVAWLAQPHAGPAAARNHGARHASHALLAFTDDDCRPRPGWVGALVAALEASPGAVAGGHTVNALEGNLFSGASQALVSYITSYGLRHGMPFFASNNLALSREDFLQLGGFDESFHLAGGEDRDFSDRCAGRGMAFVHRRDALVDHHHDLGVRSYWTQHYRYGQGAYQFHQLRTSRRGSTILRDTGRMVRSMDLRFYVDLVRFPFLDDETPRRLPTSALLLLSQVPNALGFFAGWLREARARRGRGVQGHAAR